MPLPISRAVLLMLAPTDLPPDWEVAALPGSPSSEYAGQASAKKITEAAMQVDFMAISGGRAAL